MKTLRWGRSDDNIKLGSKPTVEDVRLHYENYYSDSESLTQEAGWWSRRCWGWRMWWRGGRGRSIGACEKCGVNGTRSWADARRWSDRLRGNDMEGDDW